MQHFFDSLPRKIDKNKSWFYYKTEKFKKKITNPFFTEYLNLILPVYAFCNVFVTNTIINYSTMFRSMREFWFPEDISFLIICSFALRTK